MNEKQRHSLAWAYILHEPFVLAYDFNLLQRRNEVTFLTIVNREFFTHWRSPVATTEVTHLGYNKRKRGPSEHPMLM